MSEDATMTDSDPALTSEASTEPWLSTEGVQLPHDDSKQQICDDYRFVMSVGVLGTICISGIVGNILAMVGLTSFSRASTDKHVRSSTGLLLTALAVADIMVLTSLLFLKSLPTLFGFTKTLPEYFDVFFPYLLVYGWPLCDTAHALSTWLTVLVTTHRYIAICKPHRAVYLCAASQTKKHLAALVVLVCLFELPTFLDHYLSTEKDANNATVLVYTYAKLSDSDIYQVAYKTTASYVVLYIVPLLILAVLTALLVRELKKATRLRLDLVAANSTNGANPKKADDSVTLTLVVVVIVCMICQPWEPVRRIIEAILDGQPGCGHFYFYYEEFPSLSFAVNSAANFAIYCLCGSRFRTCLRQTLCGGSLKYRENEISSGGNQQPSVKHTEVSTVSTGAVPDI